MTPKEELELLRLENRELRLKIRKHREIGEQAELDLRELQHKVGRACAYAEPLLHKEDPACVLCLARLAKVISVLKEEDSSPSTPAAVD